MASPRRTARYERIPPDGFGVAALEVKLHGKTPPPASLVPLVLSGPLCPAGISPPRGESPLSGEAFLPCKFLSTKIPRRGIQAAAAAVTLPFLQLKLGRKVSGDPPLSLLKRKKEAKKEKSSRFTCTVRQMHHPKIIQRIFRLCKIFYIYVETPPPPNGGPPPLSGEAFFCLVNFRQQNSPGGAYRRLPPP